VQPVDDDDQAQSDAIAAAVRLHRGQVGARSWAAGLADWSRSVSEAVIGVARPDLATRILDVSSGRGEPAIRMARLLRPSARIIATDPSREYLEVIAAQVTKPALAGIGICGAAAEALPFMDESFDLVTCQLGIAFFADPVRGLAEMRRVLRRAGRLVLATWGPADQSSIYASTIGIIGSHVEVVPPDGEVPDPYHYGDGELLAAELRCAGFSKSEEWLAMVELIWTGDAVGLWSMVEATNRTIQHVLGNLPNKRRLMIIEEILALLTSHRRGGKLVLPVALRLAVAKRL
jgi:SAM-dependent methyltransferase